MFNRLRSVALKELIQLTRDPLLLLFVLFAPLAELILVGGMGGGGGPAGLRAALIDRDMSTLSREVALAVENTGDLDIRYYPQTLEEGSQLIDEGAVTALIVIPEGFEADLRGGGNASVQLILDGSNVLAAGEAQAAAQGAIQSLGGRVLLEQVPTGASVGGIELRQEVLYNATLDGQPEEITSLFALIVFQIVTLSGVMTIVREREVGTLEQVQVTPIRGLEFITGKAIAPVLVTLADYVIMLVVIWLLFDVPMRGSLILLTVLTVLYLVSEVCVALLISAASRSQGQAITIVFVWVMYALTMSGFLVPVSGLPKVLQWVAWALPVQHYITIARSLLLKGAGLGVLWPNVLALLVLAVAMGTLTMALLRRIGE